MTLKKTSDMSFEELFDEHGDKLATLKRRYKKELLETPLSKRKSNQLLSLMTTLYSDKSDRKQ